MLAQRFKPKTSGILLIIIGAGITALLVTILEFLRGEIAPLAGGKPDFAVVLFGPVLLLFALQVFPIIGDTLMGNALWYSLSCPKGSLNGSVHVTKY